MTIGAFWRTRSVQPAFQGALVGTRFAKPISVELNGFAKMPPRSRPST